MRVSRRTSPWETVCGERAAKSSKRTGERRKKEGIVGGLGSVLSLPEMAWLVTSSSVVVSRIVWRQRSSCRQGMSGRLMLGPQSRGKRNARQCRCGWRVNFFFVEYNKVCGNNRSSIE